MVIGPTLAQKHMVKNSLCILLNSVNCDIDQNNIHTEKWGNRKKGHKMPPTSKHHDTDLAVNIR